MTADIASVCVCVYLSSLAGFAALSGRLFVFIVFKVDITIKSIFSYVSPTHTHTQAAVLLVSLSASRVVVEAAVITPRAFRTTSTLRTTKNPSRRSSTSWILSLTSGARTLT